MKKLIKFLDRITPAVHVVLFEVLPTLVFIGASILGCKKRNGLMALVCLAGALATYTSMYDGIGKLIEYKERSHKE